MTINKILSATTSLLAISGGSILLLSAIMTLMSVVGRAVFNSPINGDFELVEIASALAIFSFLPWVMLNRGNITIELFTKQASNSSKKILDGIAQIIFAVILAMFAVYAGLGAHDAFIYNEQSQILGIPIWLGMSYGALCFALTTLVCLHKAFSAK